MKILNHCTTLMHVPLESSKKTQQYLLKYQQEFQFRFFYFCKMIIPQVIIRKNNNQHLLSIDYVQGILLIAFALVILFNTSFCSPLEQVLLLFLFYNLSLNDIQCLPRPELAPLAPQQAASPVYIFNAQSPPFQCHLTYEKWGSGMGDRENMDEGMNVGERAHFHQESKLSFAAVEFLFLFLSWWFLLKLKISFSSFLLLHRNLR